MKDMIWYLKSFRWPEINGMKIDWKDLILSIKGCPKQMKHKHTSTMLMRQYLAYFYYQSEGQKNSELLFITVGTGLATYALYKYLK